MYFNSTKAKNAAESNEIKLQSGTNSSESIENGAESGILKTEKSATGHEITAKILKNEHYDKQQYENYKQVVGDIVPKTLAEFRKLKYSEPEAWKDLQAKFKIVNRYEVDGNVSTEEILKLDEIAWNTKRKGFAYRAFSGRTAKKIKNLSRSGNGASMSFNGTNYFAHSQIDNIDDILQDCYIGKYKIVGLSKNQLFKTFNLNGYDRSVDTEAKFLEYVAHKANSEDEFTVTILSERHICESCQGVVTQFKAMFPKATVNIISGKKGYNNDPEGNHTWTYRKGG